MRSETLREWGTMRDGDGPTHRTTKTRTRATGLQQPRTCQGKQGHRAHNAHFVRGLARCKAQMRSSSQFHSSTAFRIVRHHRVALRQTYGCCVAPGKPRPMCPVHAMPPRLLGRKYNRSFQTTLTGCVLRSNHLKAGTCFRQFKAIRERGSRSAGGGRGKAERRAN